ncbi:hypothetical protein SAMN06298216_0601 [Spirosomataceae bacterium TFI 002]|nr:hypothetical protein SAMN06298216_0601 [Spirosomataceae bacterium TFI 002]
MKSILTSILLTATVIASFAQDSTNFFEGKWDVLIKETPSGDVVMPMTFTKEDGEYVGYFTDESGEQKRMDKVTDDLDKISMAFYIAGYDVTMDLEKVDENHMSGMVMGMLTAEATRVTEEVAEVEDELTEVKIEKIYFEDKWSVFIEGTPNGDVTLQMSFEEKDGTMKGYVTNPQDQSQIEMTTVNIDNDQLIAGFSMMGYDLSMTLQKEDEDVATGSLMDMFTTTATRVKGE